MAATAPYVARKTAKGVTHTIREGWSYDRITDAVTGCGIPGPFTIEHYSSGRPMAVTCRRPGCTGGN